MYIFITASNALYSKAREYNVKMALRKGHFDKVLSYDFDSMIDDAFRKAHEDILSVKKGAGLWLWKPYFVHKALMEECQEGDILFYLDTAAFFIRDIRNIVRVMDDDIYACNLPYIEGDFTKKEAFELLNLSMDEFKNSRQFQASFMAFRKSDRSVKFVEEWLKACCDMNIISPNVNFGEQIATFQEHRMDQSCFSLMCKKYHVRPHEDPTQYGFYGYPKFSVKRYLKVGRTKEYPITIIIHRVKDLGFINKLRIVKRNIEKIKLLIIEKR